MLRLNILIIIINNVISNILCWMYLAGIVGIAHHGKELPQQDPGFG